MTKWRDGGEKVVKKQGVYSKHFNFVRKGAWLDDENKLIIKLIRFWKTIDWRRKKISGKKN